MRRTKDHSLADSRSRTIARLAVGILIPAASPFVVSCRDASTAPRAGNVAERLGTIVVSTTTKGIELAPARYAVTVDGGTEQPIAVNGSLALQVREGTHMVTLRGAGEHCYARGAMSRSTFVAFNQSEPVEFDVTCAPTVEIRITTATDGPDAGNGYRLIAIAEDSSRTDTFTLPLSGAVTVRLFAGTYRVSLAGLAANCALQGEATRRVVATPEMQPVVQFTVGCTAARQLAFVRDGQVYLVKSDGSELVRVGSGEQPAWSPDGQRLAVVQDGAIWIMNANGSDAHVLTASTTYRYPMAPAWSPDGRKIAFSAYDDQGGVFIVSLEDDDVPIRRVGFDRGYHGWPAWSPDGQTIVFVSDWMAFDFAFDIYAVNAVNASGSEPTQLTNGFFDNVSTWPSYMMYVQPAWSPGGQRIALVACPAWQYYDCNVSSIAIMNADGSNMRTLSAAGGFARPTWSPDGRMIAFGQTCWDHQCPNVEAVHVLPADGSDSGVVIARGHDPAWRP
jgi:hypothetical protein